MTCGDFGRIAAVAAISGIAVVGIHSFVSAQKKKGEIITAQNKFSEQLKASQAQQSERVQTVVKTRNRMEEEINKARTANGLPPLDLARVQKYCTTGKL